MCPCIIAEKLTAPWLRREGGSALAVKIGIGMSGWPFGDEGPDALWQWVEHAERSGIDSIWLTDRVVSDRLNVEPIVALSFVAARTKRMLVGTSVLALPLRQPTILAKEIATLDFLSGGRVLPAIGLGTEDEREYEAAGVTRSDRAARTDEMVEVMRLLWSGEPVTYTGRFFSLTDVVLRPRPTRPEMPPIWVGGRSHAALRRVARLGDGWLASQVTPDEVFAGKRTIDALAGDYGRAIDDDHHGVILTYCFADSRAEAERLTEPYQIPGRRRTDVEPERLDALGTVSSVTALLDEFVQAGATKFVLRAACPPQMMGEQLQVLIDEVIPKYHR
jgi:probable F420-dependent oxidoreductase